MRKLTQICWHVQRGLKKKVICHELEIKGEKFLIERENFFFKGLNREFIDLIDYSSKG